jgi:two-component system OmpR family response regulator
MSSEWIQKKDGYHNLTTEKHILVVDDEPEMTEAISEYLSLRGFIVSTAANGKEMHGVLETNSVDLVLLDLGLPGEDGISLAREIRASMQIGIIIVTAFGEAEDRVLGLESGADDYVVKPFGLRELLARVRSVLRRTEADSMDVGGGGVSKAYDFGNASYDRSARIFHRADGTTVQLSTGECDLLELFHGKPDSPISRDELVEETTHRGWKPFDRSIDVRINRLRQKIEDDPLHPQIIRTVRGVGYLFHSNK